MKKEIIRKTLSVFLTVSLVCSAAGCGKAQVSEETADEQQDMPPQQEEETVEEAVEKEVEEPDKADGSATENMLENGDFSSGTDLWQTFCQDGDCAISVNSDTFLDVDIKNPGTVAHGVQVYHDGFSLEEGCVYNISFDGYADIKRPVEMRFQLNGGDYHAYYQEFVELTEEMTHYDFSFTMGETTDPAPRFCLNSGIVGDMGKDTAPHHIYFDNFVLSLTDDSNKVEGSGQIQVPDIAVNQVGYLPKSYKSAVVKEPLLGQSLKLVNEDTGETVLEKQHGEVIYDTDTGDNEAVFDFTEISEKGKYHIESGDTVSHSFVISDDAYDEAFRAAIKMLYYQRCGTELTKDLAGDFAHPACHTDKAVLYEDKSVELDVTGGWHDAGDYGRYSVSGAKALADLLLAYENYPEVFTDDLGIPESGNGISDVLDEGRYELEWLFKMQADNGGVYHKVTCRNFPAEVMPQDETDQLIVMPVTTTATGDFAAVMALASRVYKDVDKELADRCLAAAIKAAKYLDETPSDTKGYKNPSDISTGEYLDECDIDERFWAYAELFKTTGDASYEKALETVLPGNGFTLGWQGVGGYGAYAYLTAPATDDAFKDYVLTEADDMSEYITSCADKYCYGSSIIDSYPWGSNLTIANNGEFMLMMKDIVNSYNKVTVDKQLNYLLGNNSTGYSFLTGFGTVYSEHPHHRPSQATGITVPGMLVGGPNNGLEDPYVQNVLKNVPIAKCYADNAQSYSTNEVTIYWNSPFIYLMAGEIAETK